MISSLNENSTEKQNTQDLRASYHIYFNKIIWRTHCQKKKTFLQMLVSTKSTVSPNIYQPKCGNWTAFASFFLWRSLSFKCSYFKFIWLVMIIAGVSDRLSHKIDDSASTTVTMYLTSLIETEGRRFSTSSKALKSNIKLLTISCTNGRYEQHAGENTCQPHQDFSSLISGSKQWLAWSSSTREAAEALVADTACPSGWQPKSLHASPRSSWKQLLKSGRGRPVGCNIWRNRQGRGAQNTSRCLCWLAPEGTREDNKQWSALLHINTVIIIMHKTSVDPQGSEGIFLILTTCLKELAKITKAKCFIQYLKRDGSESDE